MTVINQSTVEIKRIVFIYSYAVADTIMCLESRGISLLGKTRLRRHLWLRLRSHKLLIGTYEGILLVLAEKPEYKHKIS